MHAFLLKVKKKKKEKDERNKECQLQKSSFADISKIQCEKQRLKWTILLVGSHPSSTMNVLGASIDKEIILE